MSSTDSQGLILPRCEIKWVRYQRLQGVFQNTYWWLSLQHVFSTCFECAHVCAWETGWMRWRGKSDDLVCPSPVPSLNLSEAWTLPQQKQRGNHPTQTGRSARWPVAVCREAGMLLNRCVCVCVALFYYVYGVTLQGAHNTCERDTSVKPKMVEVKSLKCQKLILWLHVRTE